ncbi:MAG: hypothetical protein NTV46_21865 [Verrucomicrobia bacterium]|nr:hypothetical protein [Verrucomicrobiota bacterium]
MQHDLRSIARQFQIHGGFQTAAPYGSGHINDTYFKVHRDGHNLDRCRTQFKLLESIERQQAAMRQLVASLGA